MNHLAVTHRATDNYAYACANGEVCLMIKTAKDDIHSIQLIHGDPYDWQNKKWVCNETTMSKSGSDALFDYWKMHLKPEYKRLRYGFELNDGANIIFFGENGFKAERPTDIAQYFCIPFVHPSEVFTPPSWVQDTVWYQIFPERFANGNKTNDPKGSLAWGSSEPKVDNFFGGDLDGVIENIDYLKHLGIGGIYFTPIFTAYSNHKYDTIDYMEIDPQFGDKETLKKLITICHKNGIKVMLDAVFNHSGYYFPPFQDVLENGEDSKYKDWFYIRDFPVVTDPAPNYDTFAFTPFMPKLNTQNQEVRTYLLDVARYWVEEFDIDGWRLDVANEVDHDFWREFRREVKDIKADLYILGEIWHDSMPWLRGDQFDAVMNYPLTRNVLDLFAKKVITTKEFVENMTTVMYMYPDTVNATAFNLVGSHDTPRILNECMGDKRRLKQIFTFMLTFMGTPCIYYGDEIGMDGGEDPGCRKCMVWNESQQDRDMFNHVRKLISLRKEHPLLANDGELSFLHEETADSNCFGFMKSNKNKKILIIFNTADQEGEFQIPVELADHQMLNLWSDSPFSDSTITLEPYDFIILELT